MILPKLPRSFMRDEDKPGYEKEIWQPKWDCFCCQDSGIVIPRLTSLVIEGYDCNKDKVPLCQKPGCDAGGLLEANEILAKSLDLRLNAFICSKLDEISREDWRQTMYQNHLRRQEIQEQLQQLAKEKSLRQRDRTSTEKMTAQQKHAAARDEWGIEANTYKEKQFVNEWKVVMEDT